MTDDLTELLQAASQEDPQAAEALLPAIYDELRKLASARMAKIPPGQTLQATALVHEAWLRIQKSGSQEWQSRGHFFAAAAEAMRRILVDQARRKSRQRHGGDLERVNCDDTVILSEAPEDKILLIHEALDHLGAEDGQMAAIVKLRFFAGLKNDEIGNVLDLSDKTVRRRWNAAKVRLLELIEGLQSE